MARLQKIDLLYKIEQCSGKRMISITEKLLSLGQEMAKNPMAAA